jgi:DNA-binding response OmpR family regulator
MRILIIEDDPDIAELEQIYLNNAGFTSDWEVEPLRALERLNSMAYEAVVLDLMLPGPIDGYEICKQIRQSHQIPVIMVSARSEEFDKIKGFGIGADDYITKPFRPGELVARIKAHISRYQLLTRKEASEHSDHLICHGLKIERKARRVFRAEQELVLSVKEYDLLVFLMEHPNQVFTKEHLFERVWGMDAASDVTTVTVHIRRLREKIEDQPSKPQIIETVWGVGYRLKM